MSAMVESAAGVDGAVALIARRMYGRLDEALDAMVERYRTEIVDYGRLDEETRRIDVRAFSEDNLVCFLNNLGGRLLEPEELERMRERAAGRVHQDVSLEALLHALRIWGSTLWSEVVHAADPDSPAELQAALQLAGRVLEHVDAVSTACTQGYVDEALGVWSDREIVRRDLLDSLLGGQATPEALCRDAASLKLELADAYVVVIARAGETIDMREPRPPLSARAGLRHAAEIARRHLRPAAGSLLVGIRQGEMLALYPAALPTELGPIRRQCDLLAGALASRGFRVGLSSWHPGLDGIPPAYSEARDAVDFAAREGSRGRTVAFDEILVEHVVRSNPQAERVLSNVLAPLRDYDVKHRSQLIATLRAYAQSGYNFSRAAKALMVHTNTVVYRLKRIQELTGRDPHDPDDLLLLVLALKLDSAQRDRLGEQVR